MISQLQNFPGKEIYGYRDPQAEFCPIHAYNCKAEQCDNIAGGGWPLVQIFSNRNYLYNGKPIGSNQQDNTRHMNEMTVTVASE